MMNKILPAFLLIYLLGLPVLVKASGEVRTYKAPKEERVLAAIEPQSGPEGIVIEDVRKPAYRLLWSVPEGWVQDETSSDLQEINIIVPSASTNDANEATYATIVTLPGETGGIVANVNRWRDQVGLMPQQEDEVMAQIRTLESQHGAVSSFEIEGNEKAVLVAFIEQPDETAFIKIIGDKNTVAENRETFQEFVKSVHYVEIDDTVEDMNDDTAE